VLFSSEVGGGKHALLLFATGLAGLGLLGWRRKKKVQAATA